MGEVLQGPWGNRSAAPSKATEGASSPATPPRPSDPAEPPEPARWAVPGVDPGGTEEPVDADEPVPVPTRSGRRAENVSLAVLAGHDTSEAEMRQRLARKGLEPADVDAEVDRLRRSGLLDDDAFAQRLIARLRDRKGLGDGALRAALRQRLIAAEVVDAAIAAAGEDAETVHDRLQDVADERARRLGGLAPDVAERRLLAYLQRRGYSGSAARDAARAALRPDG